MSRTHEILAFRRSETLTLQIFQITDRFPRQAPPALVQRLRQLTPAISGTILDGCARHHRESALGSWSTALRLLEALADGIDEADGRGLLDPDTVLELLEAQSATWVEVLCLANEARKEAGKEASQAPGHEAGQEAVQDDTRRVA